MNTKRLTIYDLGRELNISPSYISKALNDHPSVSTKMREVVKNKAEELNYKRNSRAANFRQGSSLTLGVIVPHINKSFFSEAIAGIEEACFANNHNLIICQSHDSYKKEVQAIDMLVRQNVDCILISVAAETSTADHMLNIQNNKIKIIQFDRYIENLASHRVLNNDEDTACEVVKHLVNEGYKRIAFIGGPEHLTTFQLRKKGYINAVREAGLDLLPDFIFDNALSPQRTIEITQYLLTVNNPPDAIIAVSDHQSLDILQVAMSLGVDVPSQLGIIGFANEELTGVAKPALSSVDQQSKEIGKKAAEMYFEITANSKKLLQTEFQDAIIPTKILIRESTQRRLALQ